MGLGQDTFFVVESIVGFTSKQIFSLQNSCYYIRSNTHFCQLNSMCTIELTKTGLLKKLRNVNM